MFIQKSNKLAIVDFDGTKIDYSTLIANVKYYCDKLDIKDDDFHTIMMIENRKEFIYTLFAIWNKKNSPVIIDALSNVDELIYFIKDSESKRVIVTNKNIEVAMLAKEKLKNENIYFEIINIDEISVNDKDLEKYYNDDNDLKTPIGDDTAIMMYTSGTTSNPKGVMLSYNNIISEIEAIKDFEIDDRISKKEQVLVMLPLHHILPLMITCLYFLNQTYSIVLLKNLSSKDILEAIKKNNITLLVAVPRVYKLFYQNIKNTINSSFISRNIFKLAKLINSKTISRILFKKVHNMFGGKIKYLLSGGAKSDVEMIEFFNTLGFTYCEGYGLTETSPVFLGSVPKNYKVGTVGKKVKNVEIKVVDSELWVKGPIVMKGYYKKEDKTKEVLTDDGWFKTGDLVEIDENGYITIVGRKNSMIVLSNGKNIDPELLEEKLYSKYKFGIKEVAFLSNNDKLSAIIVVDQKELNRNGIINISTFVQNGIEYYNSEVHNYAKILEYKIFNEELPRTRIGKLRRFKLNEMYNGTNKKSEKERKEEPTFDEYLILKEYLEKSKGITVYADDTFEVELGLDSLDFVELIAYIENNFKLKIDEKLIAENNTCEKLALYIKNHAKGYNKKDINWNEIINNVEITEVKTGVLIYLLKPVIYILAKIYFRLKIKDKKLIEKGQKIYISNHQSFVDALVLSLLTENNTYFLAINLYFKSKFMRFLAKYGNVILIDIENNVIESIQKISNVLKQNNNIFIFPEGTRTKDGEMLPFKKIFAILSKELNIPVECLKIEGAYEAYSRHMLLPRPKKITVKYLGKVFPNNKSYEELVKECEKMYK